MSLLEVKGLKKIYKTRFGGQSVEALKNVNFSVEEGEYVAIMGESGSGKINILQRFNGLTAEPCFVDLFKSLDFEQTHLRVPPNISFTPLL